MGRQGDKDRGRGKEREGEGEKKRERDNSTEIGVKMPLKDKLTHPRTHTQPPCWQL